MDSYALSASIVCGWHELAGLFHPRPSRLIAAAAAIALAGALACGLPAARAASKGPEGPEIILDERPGSDVVCIMAALPVGSSCEGPGIRGACHLIEHMVFDGSERYSREEISGWVDDVGGFLNAFTRKETTVYFLMVPSAHIEKGVEILSQMLFHSLFKPAELEKERKVIAEEMRREADDPRSAGERAIDRILYRGSSLAEPITGYAATIESMSDDAVKAFYRKHYVPRGMRIVFVGGFDRELAASLVSDYFAAGGGVSRAARPGSCGAPSVPRWTGELVELVEPNASGGLDILLPFPAADEKGFPAALLVSRLLESRDSPLALKCAELSLPEPEVSVEMYRGFSALRVHVGSSEIGADAYRRVPAALESLADWAPSKEAIEKARTSFLSNEIFDREMYHFYVMSRGEAIALFGERYLSIFDDALPAVTAKDCAAALRRFFRPLRFNGCLVAKEAGAHPSAGIPETEAPAILVLPNGCTVGALSRSGSPVAALHLLLEGRTCGEGPGAAGLTEILMTALESSRAGRELSQRLEALGARVQFGDNPYVPQDDYLVSPAFAFVRLEAPASAMHGAAGLLIEHLLASEISVDDLEEVKKILAREVGMRSASPYHVMRGAMMGALLGEHPFGSSVFPSPGPMMKVSIEDIQALRARVFTGGNIIATLVSAEAPEAGCEMLREFLADLPPAAAVGCPPLPGAPKPGAIEKTIRKEGAYIAAGWFARSAGLTETASILVAGEILSRRMQLELREKRGLAYSIECSVTPLPGGAAVMAYLGTGPERIEEARLSLEAEIRGLGERPPDAEEVEIAKGRLIGKRSRSELSSINKAYALGFDILLGGADSFRSLKSLIGGVMAQEAGKAIEGVFLWDGAVTVRLLPEAPSGR